MFIANPRVQGVSPELVELFMKVDPSTIGHMTDFGFLKGLKPLRRPIRFVGNAVTVRIPHMDSCAVHKAMELTKPGDVIVVDMSGDTERSCWGGMVSYAAHVKKLAGAIICGCINDVPEITELDFPVFSLGVSPLTTKILGIEGEVNTPISICGVTVNPGDLVAANCDGVFVANPALAEKYGRKAIEIQLGEVNLRKKLDEGAELGKLSGASKYFE